MESVNFLCAVMSITKGVHHMIPKSAASTWFVLIGHCSRRQNTIAVLRLFNQVGHNSIYARIRTQCWLSWTHELGVEAIKECRAIWEWGCTCHHQRSISMRIWGVLPTTALTHESIHRRSVWHALKCSIRTEQCSRTASDNRNQTIPPTLEPAGVKIEADWMMLVTGYWRD